MNPHAEEDEDDKRKAANRAKETKKYDFYSMLPNALNEAQEKFQASSLADAITTRLVEEVSDEPGPSKPAPQSDDDDDFVVELPPGFVVDESVVVKTDQVAKIPTDIPMEKVAHLKHGDHPITSIAFDTTGSKFFTGCYNYTVKLFDFQHMNKSLQPYRTINPCERQIITNISISNNGENILVCNSNPVMYILDRNGTQYADTARGDQYLVDIGKTKGHTACVNYSCWNPIKKDEFLTCSNDGSLRIWSLDNFNEISKSVNTHKYLIRIKSPTGKKVLPNCCAYSCNVKFVSAGCEDGSLYIWKNGKIFVAPVYSNKTAHREPVTSICFSPDSTKLVSRSLDGTMKIWNITKMAAPEKVIEGLQNDHRNTDCGYSPNGNIIFTICSESHKKEGGRVVFYDAKTYQLIYDHKLPKDPTRMVWHPKLGQIIIGYTDGSIDNFYNDVVSSKGVIDALKKAAKKTNKDAYIQQEHIVAPLALEMFQPRGEEGEEKDVTEWRLRRILKMNSGFQKPTYKTPAPNPKDAEVKAGGTLHSYLARNMGIDRNKDLYSEDDVRASILKHAEEAEKNPTYTGSAYGVTQPKTIFQKTYDDEDEEESGIPRKVKRFGQ
uniref:WD_REPEATS_REGION domain-containing protein n=1 Tax=Rhabditophanes sp. KR3021 TaxID=114890 RepID=A0AC35UG55_9BILA